MLFLPLGNVPRSIFMNTFNDLAFMTATQNPLTIGSGCVGYWSCNENKATNGSTLHDFSGYGNNGIMDGTAVYPALVAGHTGSALYGVADAAVLLKNPAVFQITGSITLALWVNGTSNTYDKGLITKYTYPNPGAYSLQTGDNYRHARFITYSGSNTQIAVEGTKSIIDGNWHSVVATYDMHVMRLYVDGVLDAGLSASHPINNSADNVVFMARTNGTADRINGTCDDFRIYNRALTPDEIAILAKS